MNRYDDRARLVFHYAREEGNRLGHAMVGPEHLLLGLMREAGNAAQILGEFGASLDELRKRVEDIIGRGSGNRLNDAPSITPRARRVMELASAEARSLGAGVTSTEHILLGIIREGDGVAYRILQELTQDVEVIRWRILSQVQEAPTTHPSEWKEQVRVQFSHTPPVGDARPARDQLLDIIHADYAVPEGQDPAHFVARMLRAGHDPEVAVLLADVCHAWLRSEQLDDDRRRALIDLLVHWAVR